MGIKVNMENIKTKLYNLHQKHGAKFVPFAGYEMPIQYPEGIVEEHKYTRSDAGLFDVSHMGQLFIKGGEELTADLEKIFPLDLKNISLNQSKYSFLMNEEAFIHDDLIITKVEGGYNIILNAACKNEDYQIIAKLLNNKYEMVLNSDLSLIAIQGPKAANILKEVIAGPDNLNFMNGDWFNYSDDKVYITRSGYTGEDGFEISIGNNKVEDLVKNGEVDITSQYESLHKHKLPGDFRFIVLEQKLSADNSLPLHEKIFMQIYFILKKTVNRISISG